MSTVNKADSHPRSNGYEWEAGLLRYMVDCSILFEYRIAELYEHLSGYLPPMLAEILLHLARESRNHAQFFIFLKKTLGSGNNECVGNKTLVFIEELLEKARNTSLSPTVVKELLEECIGLEKSIGEEYHVKLLSHIIKANLKITLGNTPGIEGLRVILEEIEVEENYHASLLEKVIENLGLNNPPHNVSS